MRTWVIVPLLLAGACSGEAEAPKKEQAAAERLSAGQWELTTEVTEFSKGDQGTPNIDTPAGTRASSSACIPEADGKKPNPSLFSDARDECSYSNFYMARGRLSASVNCTRQGLDGNISTNVDGSYTADTMEATLRTDTAFSADGDVRFTRKLTGRRVGECIPEAASKPS
jgi:hypothetical protein